MKIIIRIQLEDGRETEDAFSHYESAIGHLEDLRESFNDKFATENEETSTN